MRFIAPMHADKPVCNRIKIAAGEGKSDGRWLVTTENKQAGKRQCHGGHLEKEKVRYVELGAASLMQIIFRGR